MTLLLLAAAIVSEVSATLALRAADGFTHKRWLPVVVVGYVGSFFLLAAVLDRGMGVGVAYGIWAATGVALTAVAARFLFHDPLTKVMAAGIGLIAAGVLIVELAASHA